MIGGEDLYRLLRFHITSDPSVFHTEDDRHDLATLLLFHAYTGCRPHELVQKTRKEDPLLGPNDDMDLDDIDDSTAQSGYDQVPKKYRLLCYKDIALWIVPNPTSGKRDLLAMEVTLLWHKGENNKSKP